MANTAKKSKTRRPGAGRKPKGNFRENSALISMRIQSDLKRELEKLAKASGWSLSQAAQEAMATGLPMINYRDTFKKTGQEKQNPSRALGHFVRLMGERSRMKFRDGKKFDWQTDQFFREALRLAFDHLLSKLEPAEDSFKDYLAGVSPNMHPMVLQNLTSPQSFAAVVFDGVWSEMMDMTEIAHDLMKDLPNSTQKQALSKMKYKSTAAQMRSDFGLGEDK